MYHQYFGLKEPAFSIAVNPRYLYMSDQHKEALAHLVYGVSGGGFVLLTGEVGTGKTTIIRSLLEQVPAHSDIAMVLNPMANVPEMLSMICDELGAAYPPERPTVKTLTDALHVYLLENYRRGRNTVLLIDEAQLLSADVLEQIRLLTNLETNTQKLLQIVLVGQPELNQLLSQPRLRQLAQRITARFHLHPLTLAETRAYISHRLRVAGLGTERNPFPAAIIKKIHRFSGGIPRRINILCERALVGLYGHNKHRVDNTIFALARKEVVGYIDDISTPQHHWLKFSTLAVLLLLLAAFAIAMATIWQRFDNITEPPAARSPAQQTEIKEAAAKAAEPQAVVKNSPAAPVISAPKYIIRRLPEAQKLLFNYLQIPPEQRPPCWQRSLGALQCDTDKLASWRDLAQLNRPSVLTLTTADKFIAYGVLVGLSQQQAWLLTDEGDIQPVALTTLGAQWTGQVLYTWHRPLGFVKPLSQGDVNPAVAWLAKQFAALDGQQQPLTGKHYNRALAQRLTIFQRRMGLTADGILGKQTLLKLNELLAIDKTLITGPPQSALSPSVPGEH